MLNELYLILKSGHSQVALAQTTCCLKSVFTFLQQNGLWRGAWEYSYLPDLKESGAGISDAEKASMGRYLREKNQMEESLQKERERHANPKKKK